MDALMDQLKDDPEVTSFSRYHFVGCEDATAEGDGVKQLTVDLRLSVAQLAVVKL